MQELFPIVAGIAIGLIWRHWTEIALRAVTLAVCSLALGVIASYVSGELFVSWIYVAIDTTLVLLSAGVTLIILDRRWAVWLRREQDQSRR